MNGTIDTAIPMVPLISYKVKCNLVTMVPRGEYMSEKRTEQIAVRITPETKRILQEEAMKLEWSTAKLAEKILSEWTSKAASKGGSINFIIEKNENINIGGSK